MTQIMHPLGKCGRKSPFTFIGAIKSYLEGAFFLPPFSQCMETFALSFLMNCNPQYAKKYILNGKQPCE